MSSPRISSRFQIGDYKWSGCNNVSIEKSIHSYKDVAVITMPATAVLRSEYIAIPSRQTAQQFSVGQKVSIDLGHDGINKREFAGFVSRINYATPCQIECEGYSWVLRNKRNIKRSWAVTTLRQVLAEVVKDTDIALHPQIPDITLRNIVLNNASGTQVVDYIKGLFAGILAAFFIDNVLYMGLTYADVTRETVKYHLGWNTLPADNLKYRRADEIEVNVEIKFRNDEGKQITTRTGSPSGITRKDTITAVTDEKWLQEVAEAKLSQESYDGFDGYIDTLIVPYAQPGYRADCMDPRYPQRTGVYFVEATSLSYGIAGTRRRVGIGLKLGI